MAITDVPVLANSEDAVLLQERRAICRVLVSGLQAASLRALHYARALGLQDTRALFFAFDADEAESMRRAWEHEGVDLPLEIVEAPFRDLGGPLVEYLRSLTADPDTIVSVVMPELVFSGWRALLHNQRALYVKRLLLFESRRALDERAVPTLIARARGTRSPGIGL